MCVVPALPFYYQQLPKKEIIFLCEVCFSKTMEGEEIKPTKVSICYCSTRYIKAEEGEPGTLGVR